MPRAVTLGNGHILVGFDGRAQVRDFYFPYVGLENHLGVGQVHRVGVFADGALHWFSNPSWEIRVEYEKETAAGKVTATNAALGISCV
ncbi:MAG TPA: glycoside hydrolase family 15 protein, partial [Candidatus Paceibacterota bacterium]